MFLSRWQYCVIPVAVKVVWLESECCQFRVGDLYASRIRSTIKFGSDLQACPCRCVGDQIEDDFVTDQWSTSPILGNVREHPVLDLVPLAGAWREVGYMNWQAQADRQGLQRYLPQAAPAAVASSAIGCDHQRACIGIALDAHLVPPPPDSLNRELRGVVIDTHADPAFVATHVEHAVRDDFAQLGVREVMDVDSFRFALALPLSPVVLVRAYEFLLLRVHRDHRLRAPLHALDLRVDELKLRIAVRVRRSLQGLAVTLQAVASKVQKMRHRPCADRVTLQRQLFSEIARALASPTQRGLWIASGERRHQTIQLCAQLRIRLAQALATAASLTKTRSGFRIGISLNPPKLSCSEPDQQCF